MVHRDPWGTMRDVRPSDLDRDLTLCHLGQRCRDGNVKLARMAKANALAATHTVPGTATLSLAVRPTRGFDNKLSL